MCIERSSAEDTLELILLYKVSLFYCLAAYSIIILIPSVKSGLKDLESLWKCNSKMIWQFALWSVILLLQESEILEPRYCWNSSYKLHIDIWNISLSGWYHSINNKCDYCPNTCWWQIRHISSGVPDLHTIVYLHNHPACTWNCRLNGN